MKTIEIINTVKIIYNKITTSKIIIPFTLFCLTFIIYLNNLSPSVHGGDSGDFISAALTKGVPHPSGYPLYTMLGILFLKLPVNATPAWKMGTISALFASSSVVLTYLLTYLLSKRKIPSIATSLTLAFTYPFWLYAEVVEVISMNVFFILLITYLTANYLYKRKGYILYLLSLAVGLSLTNNLVIILLFPGAIASILFTNPKIILNWKLILKNILVVLIGLTPYLYLPIAASSDPSVNWGYPVTLVNFIKVITRYDYGWGGNLPDPSGNPRTWRLGLYIEYLKFYLNPVVTSTSLLGIIALFKRKKYEILILLGMSLLAFGPFFVSYPNKYFGSFLKLGINEKFYVNSVVFITIFMVFGYLFFENIILNLLKNLYFKKRIKYLLLIILFVIPISSFLTNQAKTNFKNIFIGDNLAVDLLFNLGPNSILVFDNDTAIFNTIYYQNAFNYRTDVLTPGRSSGFKDVFKTLGLNDKINQTFRIKARNKINPLITTNNFSLILEKRPIYSSFPERFIGLKSENIISIPLGLTYKVLFETEFDLTLEEYLTEVEKVTSNYHTDHILENKEIIRDNFILADISNLYSIAYLDIATFINDYYKSPKRAAKYLDLSLQLDPKEY